MYIDNGIYQEIHDEFTKKRPWSRPWSPSKKMHVMQGAEIHGGFQGDILILWTFYGILVTIMFVDIYGSSMDILWMFVVDIFAGGVKNNL